MAADLSRYPSTGVLDGLLAERLGGPERDSVETHVEGCAPCQEYLARVSARTFCLVAPPSGCRDEPDPEPDEGFLRRLRDVPPPVASILLSPSAPGADTPPPSPAGRAPSAAWLEHGRLGRYEILGRLAEGGMGAVYRARHAELGKVVALKVLPAGQLDEARVARFKNEIRAIGRLDHPNIVAAHDAGELGGVHFLMMDFVEGLDLARVLERQGRLSVSDACEAVRQAALGLQHAFERGLVHRDVKPSNLMLARGGRVQVLDLGLARSFAEAAADTLTARGMLLGTADYLAPEQWEHAHAADTRADIYSLGCTLYHLLAGRPPFAGGQYQSVLQKMRAHLETPPAPVGRLRPEVPAGLAAVLDRMLAKVTVQDSVRQNRGAIRKRSPSISRITGPILVRGVPKNTPSRRRAFFRIVKLNDCPPRSMRTASSVFTNPRATPSARTTLMAQHGRSTSPNPSRPQTRVGIRTPPTKTTGSISREAHRGHRENVNDLSRLRL